jgi:hypothetical protein
MFDWHLIKNFTLKSNVLVKNNTCLSCPNLQVKMDITFGQNGHFGQVGPSKMSWFVIVVVGVCKLLASFNNLS